METTATKPIRDLQLEFDTLPDEIQVIVENYGSGDCHLLTQVLIEDYDFIPMAVMAANSGMLVHSAVRLPGDRTFDAHGINPIEKTLERYQDVCQEHLGSEAYIQEVEEDFITMFAGVTEDLDIGREDLGTLMAFLGFDPKKEVAESRAENVTTYLA